MKMNVLLGLIGIAFFSLAQPTWAGPRGGGGGGGPFGGGGRVGRFAGGRSRGGPPFHGVVFPAPAFRGAYFTGRSIGRPNVAPRSYYGGTRMSAVRPRGFVGPWGPAAS